MSRAFVRDDDTGRDPHERFALPHREDPSYDAAAAFALLEAAREGQTSDAEQATGYRFGDPHLFTHVQRLLDQEESRPEADRDRRFIQVARRFLNAG
jgi:hypothetical protein